MRVPLSIAAVPKNGKMVVRLLGSPRGILTHWQKGRTVACPGEQDCQRHDYPIWKGYSPAQIWVKMDHLWRPVVFEMTISLVEEIGTENLRGKCYSVQRLKTEYGKKACHGLEIDAGDLGRLPAPFDVQGAVERLYRTRGILWDIPPDLFLRDTAETMEGDEPSVPGTINRIDPILSTASAAEAFRKNGAVEKSSLKPPEGD